MEEINANLRVSTMTLLSNLFGKIELKNLFNELEINDVIKYIEYGELNKGQKKQSKIRKTKINKKFFYNQMTLHVYNDKIVNVKLFNNGKIQMTGAKNVNQGNEILNKISLIFKKINLSESCEIFENNEINPSEVVIAMINSDFDCGFKIKREKLHRIMVDKDYYSSYEPTIYPGVNIKYYYNDNRENCGICNCEGQCNGKGKDGYCKKITIAVFNSGKIIITGGQTYKQYNIAYDFINNVLETNKNELMLSENEDIIHRK